MHLVFSVRQIDAANDDGSTAFIYACAFGHFGIASTLITEGCDVDWRDDQGRTGAEIACAEGYAGPSCRACAVGWHPSESPWVFGETISKAEQARRRQA